jgi:hypothetical protein
MPTMPTSSSTTTNYNIIYNTNNKATDGYDPDHDDDPNDEATYRPHRFFQLHTFTNDE